MVNGKRRLIVQPLLNNILFAYGSEQELQQFVYDNVNLPFLRFYYSHLHHSNGGRVPLVVPDYQMSTFRIICLNGDSGAYVTPDKINLFESGQMVRVTQGRFAGVVGRVAQFKGQKRVGIYIEGVATAITAYIPKGFLEMADE